uniref:Uncharacterized protein n=1 Tax=Pediastrum duplex TaxID=3105 RepID=A0A2U8GI25_PEDDU|nr:hypothetical protein [Pediastrum duplex]
MRNIYFCKPVKLKILCFVCCCSFAYASFASSLLWFTLRKAEERSLRFALVLQIFSKQTNEPKSREKGSRAEAPSLQKGPLLSAFFALVLRLWFFSFFRFGGANAKKGVKEVAEKKAIKNLLCFLSFAEKVKNKADHSTNISKNEKLQIDCFTNQSSAANKYTSLEFFISLRCPLLLHFVYK